MLNMELVKALEPLQGGGNAQLFLLFQQNNLFLKLKTAHASFHKYFLMHIYFNINLKFKNWMVTSYKGGAPFVTLNLAAGTEILRGTQ
jgi:hypothetical protein